MSALAGARRNHKIVVVPAPLEVPIRSSVVAISHEATHALVVTDDDDFAICTAAGQVTVRNVPLPPRPHAFDSDGKFSLDGSRVLITGADRNVYLVDTASGEPVWTWSTFLQWPAQPDEFLGGVHTALSADGLSIGIVVYRYKVDGVLPPGGTVILSAWDPATRRYEPTAFWPKVESHVAPEFPHDKGPTAIEFHPAAGALIVRSALGVIVLNPNTPQAFTDAGEQIFGDIALCKRGDRGRRSDLDNDEIIVSPSGNGVIIRGRYVGGSGILTQHHDHPMFSVHARALGGAGTTRVQSFNGLRTGGWLLPGDDGCDAIVYQTGPANFIWSRTLTGNNQVTEHPVHQVGTHAVDLLVDEDNIRTAYILNAYNPATRTRVATAMVVLEDRIFDGPAREKIYLIYTKDRYDREILFRLTEQINLVIPELVAAVRTYI